MVYAAVCSRQWCDARSPRYSIPRTCTIFQDVPRFSTSARFVYVLGPERSGRRPKGTVVNFNVRRTNLALEFPPNSLYRAISALQDECFQEIMECSKVSECSKNCSKVNSKMFQGQLLILEHVPRSTHERPEVVLVTRCEMEWSRWCLQPVGVCLRKNRGSTSRITPPKHCSKIGEIFQP